MAYVDLLQTCKYQFRIHLIRTVFTNIFNKSHNSIHTRVNACIYSLIIIMITNIILKSKLSNNSVKYINRNLLLSMNSYVPMYIF